MMNKRLTYNDGGSKPRPKPKYINGNVIDLHPYLDDAWWDIETDKPDEISAKKKEGIMKVASAEDEREFYGGLLSPVYRRDYLESLPLNKLKELFDEYLRNMRMG